MKAIFHYKDKGEMNARILENGVSPDEMQCGVLFSCSQGRRRLKSLEVALSWQGHAVMGGCAVTIYQPSINCNGNFDHSHSAHLWDIDAHVMLRLCPP